MNILFITHKVPYPPDKGEKIRSFHILKYLSQKHKIFLFSLCNNKADLGHVTALKKYCFSVNLYPISPALSSLRAISYVFTGYPLTLGYFFSYGMKNDIKKTLKAESIDVIFASCSSSAQYALDIRGKRGIVDLMDIDSDKWKSYSEEIKSPLSLMYAMESKRLRRWERIISQKYDASLVTTEEERGKLESIIPSEENKISVLTNGVDLDYFRRLREEEARPSVVFTGQMDYFPNIDGVLYFYRSIFPLVKKEIQDMKFYIVGRNPSGAIRKSCREAVITGYVEDIREYLGKASVYVAPLRICHGIQNKILEAMAFGIPVVATTRASRAIKAVRGKDILIGDTPEEFARKTVELLKNKKERDSISKNALEYVERNHSWNKNLLRLDEIISRPT